MTYFLYLAARRTRSLLSKRVVPMMEPIGPLLLQAAEVADSPWSLPVYTCYFDSSIGVDLV